MTSAVVLDRLLVEALVPRTRTGRDPAAARRVLGDPSFRPRLKPVPRLPVLAYRALAAVRLCVGR